MSVKPMLVVAGLKNEVEARVPRKRKGTPRSRSGCITCRNRKKKCDGAFPICQQCSRLNYNCLREEPRSHVPANAHRWKTPPKSIVKLAKPIESSETPSPIGRSLDASGLHVNDDISREVSASRKEMLRYYISDFCNLITTNVENNSFLSVFLPMAMDSPTLLNAILALSSTHLSLKDDNYQQTALQFRGVSLNSLSSTLSSRVGESDLETALASCLVLCSMETILGDTGQWYQHLRGAYHVIESSSALELGYNKILVPTALLATTDGSWLLRNFAYHDVMMSNQNESIPDSYFGLASRLIYLISEVSVLNADMVGATGSLRSRQSSAEQTDLVVSDFIEDGSDNGLPEGTETISDRAHQLEKELLEWQCAPSQNASLIGLAEAYRLGALVHLYQSLQRHLSDLRPTFTYKIAQVIDNMMECLETIPNGSLPECTLLFPLFMAGGESRNVDHICIIRQRLTDILESRHFHNVKTALEVLDEVWGRRAGLIASPDGNVEWTDITRRKDWKLALT